MDIASLLSEEPAPRKGASTGKQHSSNKKRPRPSAGNRTTSLLSQEVVITPSPEPAGSSLPPSTGDVAQHRPSLVNFHRNSANAQAEASHSNTTPVHRPDLNATRSPSLSVPRHLAPPNVRTHSASDLVMAEAPVQTPPPREFIAPSVSEVDLKTIKELANYLIDHSYDYSSHVQLINLLHRGFVAHVETPIDDASTRSQPSEYALLKDLRLARGAMDSRYAVGEGIWRDWIDDESMLAQTSEDRQAVMELCQKAVQEEPASVVLWTLYGEWVWQTYAIANGLIETDDTTWSEEDMMICKEVFTRDMLLSVWGQAAESTKWRLDESSAIWNRYLELILRDLPERPETTTIDDVQNLFIARLQVPQAGRDPTSQMFWPFISKHKAQSWEEIMSATNELAAPAIKEYALREEHEKDLAEALHTDDNVVHYNAFAAYLIWESKRGTKKKSGPFDQELRCALYERALLQLPTMTEWWLDYVDYLTSLDAGSSAILPLLERATRHCPWSGELWARRLLRVELETKDYGAVESVKHKATNSGLLPTGGMEEVLIVYSAWCSYLRRRASEPTAPDDDVDMAEMAISGVLTDIQYDWQKLHGDSSKSDPHWRIEKIFIRFLTQARRINEAREFWRSLVPVLGHSYEFWQAYYQWEIFVWGAERTIVNLRVQTAETSPRRASAVLREAMTIRNLDWPEKIHELVASHFETHEVAAELQQAQLELRSARKFLKIRREKEAAAAAADSQQVGGANATQEPSTDLKRKREDGIDINGESAIKRSKIGAASGTVGEATESLAPSVVQGKRDREHNTVTVKNLAVDITEKKVRQFFSDCGNILSVSLVDGQNGQAITATVEFENHEDVLAATTKDKKSIDGHDIRVQAGTLSTLYVTNYPPSYSEADVRALFTSYGTVVSIRFPSLKFNQRRRFCYVQFLTAQEAQAATAVNNKVIDSQHKLVALISNPEARKDRKGATAEGRELYVGNIEHGASEGEIRAHFEQAGTIENVRMITAANGRFTGTAFLVFSSVDEAQSALSLNGSFLQERILRVSIATDKSTRDAANKKSGSTKVFETASSASPSASGPALGSAVDASESTAAKVSAASDTAHTKHGRTVALLNLPDTVNDARVHDFFVQYGPIRKLTIRRDKSGAMVEFVNFEDAGKVGLNADATSLGPDCKIGEATDLLAKRSKEHRTGSGKPTTTGTSSTIRPAQVTRPAQRGGRGGRRIGAGFRGSQPGGHGTVPGEDSKKSNEDFRQIFLQSTDATKHDGNDNE